MLMKSVINVETERALDDLQVQFNVIRDMGLANNFFLGLILLMILEWQKFLGNLT